MKKRIHVTKRILLCGFVVLAVTAAVVFFVNRENRQPTGTTTASADATNTRDTTINYGPPTEEEKQQAEDRKDEIVKEQQAGSSDKKEVTVFVTTPSKFASSNAEIGGFIQGVVEGGGTCTATVVKGSDRKTESTKGVADASTTICPPMNTQLSSGEWQLTLTYSSPAATGTATKTLVVQ